MKTAVAILNWNGKKHLEHFLPSVILHSGDAEIVVIDNASSDDSVNFLTLHYPQVKIIQNQVNGGFAQGYNEGLAKIDAEIFILLNSDIEVTENWIQPVADMLIADENLAAAQPKIRSYANKTCFEHAGAAGGFIDRDFFPFCRGRVFDTVEEDKGQYDTSSEVFWATGACLFIKAEKFRETGGFDPDFFAHMEEIDLCWRLKNKGYKIGYCHQSVVYHLGGGTLPYNSPRKTYLNFRNNLFLIHKNYYNGPLVFKMVRRLTLDGIAGVVFFMKGKFTHAWMVFRAHLHYYRQFSSLNRKRNILKQELSQKVNNTGICNFSVTFEFFVKRKRKFSELKQDTHG